MIEGESPKPSSRGGAARPKRVSAGSGTPSERATAPTQRVATVETERAEAPPPPPRPPLGRMALGLILLAMGVGWLFEALGVLDVPWDALLPVALIAVGAVLVIGSRTGRHSGLIVFGIILTITTAMVAAVNVPLVGGIGQRVFSPQSAAELERRYDLAIGQLVIDLTELAPQPGDRVEVEARVGLGELVVEVSEDVQVEARARAGLGDVQVLGGQVSGVAPERRFGICRGPSPPVESPPCIALDLSVGLGSVKVND